MSAIDSVVLMLIVELGDNVTMRLIREFDALGLFGQWINSGLRPR